MVCLGNICRSPLAEGIMQRKANEAGLEWTVDSAGTAAYHVGEAPHQLSQKVAKMNGIDISYQKARPYDKEDMLYFDKIFAMDTENFNEIKRISGELWDANKVDLLLNACYPGKNKSVPDPWYGGEDGYHRVFEMIDLACESIIAKYTKKNT